MKAVITAGGRIDGEFAQAAGTSVKALAPIRDSSMLQRIIDAVRGVGATRLAVIGGEEVRVACAAQVERFVEERPTGGENLLRALRAWPEDGEPLLYATSDLPYVTTEAVADFVARVSSDTLAAALAEFGDFSARFPGAPGFGITLAGERIVNGGLFSVPAGSAEKLAMLATRFFDARKRPWRMASLVSPLALIRFLMGRLSIADLEGIATRVLAVPACGVRHCAPEVAFDVDTIIEYKYACANS